MRVIPIYDYAGLTSGERQALETDIESRRTLGDVLAWARETNPPGRVAEIVGERLKKVAAQNQVITVTHLPQIAAMADCHYVVQKQVDKGRTVTRVRQLSDQERVAELARMLGGVKITDKTLRYAEEMIEQRAKRQTRSVTR